MTVLTIHDIARHEKTVTRENLVNGRESYREFLAFFRDRRPISEHDFIIGAHFVYGWMPTMLHLKRHDLSKAVTALNRALNSTPISDDDLTTLMEVVNGSVIGTSKLLHCVNPEVYPILDSNVAAFLKELGGWTRPIKTVQDYRLYLQECQKLVATPGFDRVHNSLSSKLPYDFRVSALRALELIMWVRGKNLKKKQRGNA